MKKLLLPLFVAIATTAVLLFSASLLTANTPFSWSGTPVFLPYIEKALPTPTPTATLTPAPTLTPTPTSTPTPLPTATPTIPPLPGGANQVCNTSGATEICAWVSNGTPNKNTNVAVYGSLRINGQPVAGQAMASTWKYKTTTVTCSTGSTGPDGIASCTRGIGNASSGYQVNITVTIGGHQVTTWFTPN